MTSIAYTKSDDTAIEMINYAYDPQRTRKALGGKSLRETPIAATCDEENGPPPSR